MDTFPTVCICIPCYNNELTIAKTLDSIINQDYPNIIIKVFDNASTDRSCEIIESFMGLSRSIELHKRLETVSGEDNFNTCIQESEGDYSAIFHSDDIYTTGMVSEQVNFLVKHEMCGAVATHANVIDQNDQLVGTRFIPNELCMQNDNELNAEDLAVLVFKYGNFVTCPSVMFRTSILKGHIKSFRGAQFKSSADLNVWLRICEKASFGFISKPLIKYRHSTVSFSFNLSRVRIDDHDMFLVLNDYLKQLDDADEKAKLLQLKNFLLLKDRANTNLNRIILNSRDYQSMSVLSNFRQAFLSRFHFKFFLIAVMVKMLIKVPFHTNIFSALLKRVKF